MNRRLRWALALAAFAPAIGAQQLFTYTELPAGPNTFAYGLPVPQPIESLTPVDGFRSYASLHARLQSLAMESTDVMAHDVGDTFNARPIWAYVVSDEDGVDVEGRPEAAFFINATTHAREWGTPEVSTGTIERLVAGAGDQGLVRFLLDNTRLVIIPVQNIDGFQQTQRWPTQVLVGLDPDVPTWPRDGRMRRKNMRGVDDDLLTFGDHLGGIDLNRNHPPFWATSVGGGGSSANPNSLTFHGGSPHSEPENRAIEIAATLGPATRFRLGIDVHSFSRVFYTGNTARVRLNTIQAGLVAKLRGHHLALSGAAYDDVPDPPNRGIGTASEYFAYEWLVPSWTLELEPRTGPQEYGGLNVNHGGFILPASQARRVRESWAETHAVAFYLMSGPPHLKRLRFHDVQTNALVRESIWRYDAGGALRRYESAPAGALERGRRYRAELAFSKPMRRRNAGGEIEALQGIVGVARNPVVQLVRDGVSSPLDTSAGSWLDDPARSLRYRDDTFAFEFVAPDASAEFQLDVAVADMTGHALDADPSTPADWSAGAWSEWENAAGIDGDVGGADRRTTLSVRDAVVTQIEILDGPRVVGEGDTVALRLRRATAGTERIDVFRHPPNGDFGPPPYIVATWLAGESGERVVPVAAAENLVDHGDLEFDVPLAESIGGVSGPLRDVRYRVLDNDGADRAVMRVREPEFLASRWEATRSGGLRELVFDRDRSYPLTTFVAGFGFRPVESQLAVHGNGALFDLVPSPSGPARLRVAGTGRLAIDRMRFAASGNGVASDEAVIDNLGEFVLTRSELGGVLNGGSEAAIVNRGTMRIERTLFLMPRPRATAPLMRNLGDSLQLESSSILQGEPEVVVDVLRGSGDESREVRIAGSTVARNVTRRPAITREDDGSGPVFGHVLLQQNAPSPAAFSPIDENCTLPGLSLDFNIEDRLQCGFVRANDRNETSVPLPAFDARLRGVAPAGVAIDGGAVAANAVATGCGLVDQRGAPRPQTRTAGATPRCDVGAIELGINPYRGIWQPERDGHGVELHTSGNQLLLVWYTYADDGQPTSYQAIAPLTGPHWEADLLQPRRDPASGAVTTPRVGRVTLDFSSDVDARIGWRFDARGTTGSERIQPARFANGEPRFEVSGVWYPPAESGYGATVTRRGEVTAVVLYYYDAAGNVRWMLGAGDAADALPLEMSSFTGFCPDCSATAMPIASRPAGTLLLHFLTPARARLDTALTYPGAAGGTWNRDEAALVPLNDAVDNSLAPLP